MTHDPVTSGPAVPVPPRSAQPLRILYVTPSYPPKIGGGERYAEVIAQMAAQAGHQVTVLTSDVATNVDFWQWHPHADSLQPTVEHAGGVTVIRYPAVGLPGAWTSLTLWRKAMVMLGALGRWTEPALCWMSRQIPHMPGLERVLQEQAPWDLVHGYNLSWEYPLVIGAQLARQHDIPLIITPFAHLGANVSARVTRNITMPHQLSMLHQAEAVLALPVAEAEGLVALGLSPDVVHAVGSGYDPAPDDLAQVPLPEGLHAPVVAFVGRISLDKGAITAAQAVLALDGASAPAPTLALMGPLDASFDRYYRTLDERQRRRIVLLGPVSEAVKHVVLEAAEMLVLPSRVDSFGIVFLEAWAHGKPVIGARAGGIPGVIDDGVDGLLVPWGDARALSEAMQFLLRDPSLAFRLGAAGRQKTASRFTWQAVYANTERIYQQVWQAHLAQHEETAP
ncbi:MAG: glycosyltransferase family 4 protein [Anaerolineae bacterium]|jgi:glycogen(starch) synthase|nr:glycosyltransferase family 4 protein [Chloroflexota bacterium]